MQNKIDTINFLSILESSNVFNKINNDDSFNISNIKALALVTSLSYKKNKRKLFFLFPTLYEAEEFVIVLSEFLDSNDYYLFSCEEMFKLSTISISNEIISDRLNAIYSTINSENSILVAHASSYVFQFNTKEKYQENIIKLNTGDLNFNKMKLLTKIKELGYNEVDHIMAMGQFALRGQILDIFDPTKDKPIRIEYFGDEIDEIRSFSLNDELSKEKYSSITIYPNTLFQVDKEYKETKLKEIEEELNLNKLKAEDRITFENYNVLLEKLRTNKYYNFEKNSSLFPLFTTSIATINSYLDSYTKFIFNRNNVESEIKRILKKQEDFFSDSYIQHESIKGESIFSNIYNVDNFIDINEDNNSLLIRECSYKCISLNNSVDIINKYLNEDYKVFIFIKEPLLNTLRNILDNKIDYSLNSNDNKVNLIEDDISSGFEIPELKIVYLSVKELYGLTSYHKKTPSRYKESKLIKRFDELMIDDYVVHEIHGVGKYQGVTTIDNLEYLKILYANDAILYVPLNQFKLIRKYSSRDSFTPTLDKLGGSTWSRKKSRIRNRINYITDQLIEIYAQRTKEIGYSLKIDDELEKEFVNSFPFKYTKGQIECMKDIKKDMASTIPMDRLVTGDVGFGKTEMAFYAAYISILNNKQAVILCPTTILSMQHYKNAISRFEQFNIKVCVFSRLVPKKTQNENIKLIKEGKIDLIIGTHRLLSDNIKFKDLGLLVIDEEQRFGVAQKEKIKDKFKNIDSLTLSATPIPRTMQLSLLNVRQLSFLEEPPLNRLPVKLFVLKKDNNLIYEIIEKELKRKGQIYYLYNNIDTIDNVKRKLEKKFKDYKIGICHGKLDEDEIENIMNDFYIGKIDILVCTTIIESGLDIPRVNTLIVENSQNFGLSQLYQIKGRVGRSDKLAYAFFFYKDDLLLSDIAQKRLNALKQFTELGSGYKIAMQDLNIRGAGDILGSEQSGFVDTLGYDAYIDLIKEVLEEKELYQKGIKENKYDFELSFSLDSMIPSSYCSVKDRLSIYSEINDIKTQDEMDLFINKINDVYGKYPLEVDNLFIKRRIEINLNCGLFSNFKEELGYYIITSSDKLLSKNNVYSKWEEKLSDIKNIIRISIQDNQFVFRINKTKDYLKNLLFFTNTIIEDFNS